MANTSVPMEFFNWDGLGQPEQLYVEQILYSAVTTCPTGQLPQFSWPIDLPASISSTNAVAVSVRAVTSEDTAAPTTEYEDYSPEVVPMETMQQQQQQPQVTEPLVSEAYNYPPPNMHLQQYPAMTQYNMYPPQCLPPPMQHPSMHMGYTTGMPMVHPNATPYMTYMGMAPNAFVPSPAVMMQPPPPYTATVDGSHHMIPPPSITASSNYSSQSTYSSSNYSPSSNYSSHTAPAIKSHERRNRKRRPPDYKPDYYKEAIEAQTTPTTKIMDVNRNLTVDAPEFVPSKQREAMQLAEMRNLTIENQAGNNDAHVNHTVASLPQNSIGREPVANNSQSDRDAAMALARAQYMPPTPPAESPEKTMDIAYRTNVQPEFSSSSCSNAMPSNQAPVIEFGGSDKNNVSDIVVSQGETNAVSGSSTSVCPNVDNSQAQMAAIGNKAGSPPAFELKKESESGLNFEFTPVNVDKSELGSSNESKSELATVIELQPEPELVKEPKSEPAPANELKSEAVAPVNKTHSEPAPVNEPKSEAVSVKSEPAPVKSEAAPVNELKSEPTPVNAPMPDSSTDTSASSPDPPKPAPAAPKPGSWAQLFSSTAQAKNATVIYAPPSASNSPAFSLAKDQSSAAEANAAPTTVSANEDKGAQKLGELLNLCALNHKSVSLQPRGLNNTGVWCYINATLQALLACPPFYHLMKAVPTVAKRDATSTPVMDSMVAFVNEFTPMAIRPPSDKALNGKGTVKQDISTGKPFEPTYVYKLLQLNKYDSAFKQGRQEDAEEFMSCVLNGLHDEMTAIMKVARGNTPPTANNHGESHNGDCNNHVKEEEAAEEEQNQQGVEEDGWEQVGPKNKSVATRNVCEYGSESPISSIFRGQMRSTVAQAGERESATLQPFFSLQLDIQHEKVHTVQDALQYFVSKEAIQGFTCNKTKQEVEITRRILLEELPPVMVLHLKCFVYDKSGGSQKLTKHIEYSVDLEINKDLLAPNVRNKYSTPASRKYKLFAVVNHHGSRAVGGHYTTYTFHPGLNGWIHIDDNMVRSVTLPQLMKFNPTKVPYLLYYRKVDLS